MTTTGAIVMDVGTSRIPSRGEMSGGGLDQDRVCAIDALEAGTPLRVGPGHSKLGKTSLRKVPRLASKSGSTERTTSQNAALWFISRRWASSWVTT